MILVLEESLGDLKSKAPTTDPYDSLSKKINVSFRQNLIKRLRLKTCLLKLKMKVKKKDKNNQIKGKLLLKIVNVEFEASQPTYSPFPALKITPVDDGPPTRKSDDLPKEPLISPPLEIFMTSIRQKVISSTILLSNTKAKESL
ncbi:unnamed protein product [Lactuca saligna]|uniref:Uncharacterized protein n=1 Tax=Lactuca saligna TaxID=75948 RepID=A0AA36E4J0_LACSI|nr:unnamed protein product [Lactuca saligna]